MNYDMTSCYFDSSNGVNKIAYYNYTPRTEPVAVLQITHGMNECIERYEHFIDFITGKGIAVIAHDHLGHGGSVENDNDFGYFAPKDGYMRLVDDMRAVTLKAGELYPGLPVAVFAHSMGTFVARLYITKYGHDNSLEEPSATLPRAFILCGTSGYVRGVDLAILEAARTAEKHGERYRSKIINRRISKNYNNKYLKKLTPYDWLTRDEAVVAKYIENKKSRFIFTASGFKDLFTMLKLVSAQDWYSSVPKDMPIYLIAGEMDPVGQFGRGVLKVYNSLKKAGVKDVKLNLYPECRHELINELNRDEIYDDVYNYLIEKLTRNPL